MTATMLPMETVDPLTVEELKLYHFGLIRTAPVDHATIGGQSWSKETYIPAREKGAQHLRRPGAVGRFTKSEVRALNDAMKTRVVRWTKQRDVGGEIRRYGKVYSTTSEHYHTTPGDEPLARYAYLVAVDKDPAQPVPEGSIEGNLLTMSRGADADKPRKV